MTEPRPDAKEARVVNVRDEPYDVYIGRPCRGHRDEGWGNPFKIGRDGTREEVISKYRVWLRDQPELQARAHRELRGKILGCWCKPKPCHGDVLAVVAEGLEPTTDGLNTQTEQLPLFDTGVTRVNRRRATQQL